ncbi:MAG: sigma-70 family RNA polymerase sigma factor [Myxococcales bacterium]|nr:sigma-70 family RNA polymerase sigma factor [Myxococcales bacterium]
MDRKTEMNLIYRVQQEGCVASYSKLLAELKLYRDVYHFIRRYLPNPCDAEEVTQETMFRAFHNIQGFDPERGRFRAWVFGIAVHQAYDRLNERKHRSLFEIEDLPLRHRSPEDMLQIMEMEEALVAAVELLGERYRRILVMYYVDGLSHKEIAVQEGITPNNAGTLLNRAKDRCLQLYEEQIQKHRDHSQLPAEPSKGTQAFADILASLNQRFLRYLSHR